MVNLGNLKINVISGQRLDRKHLKSVAEYLQSNYMKNTCPGSNPLRTTWRNKEKTLVQN